MGGNYGPILHRLWTKVHQINRACIGVIAVWIAVFRLTISCCIILEIFTIKLWSCA